MNAAFKTSIVYVLTKDNWVIDRFLGMSRKGKSIKSIENHTMFCVSELDENKRFVYSQAYFQANWLKFQVFRPRDKSSEKVNVGSHLRSLGISDVRQLDDNNRISSTFQICSNLWEVDSILPSENGAHYRGSSGSFPFLSELSRTWEPETWDFDSSDESQY